MNRIQITGRATADFEVKTTQNNIAVCSFSLAVKRPRTKDTTDFINCTAWRQGAEFLGKYAKRGDMIGVTGTLTSRSFEDKNGNKRTAWEVVADDVEILSSKGQAENADESDKAEQGNMFADMEDPAVDLPF